MYEYLSGQLIQKSMTSMVLDVAGMGYLIQIPLSTHEKLPALGQNVKVLTYFAVREDAHTLYGFFTDEERKLFKLLLLVTGIGPKLAMTVLSGVKTTELKKAIVEGQIDTLKLISGIGKKTAERIVVELREKIVLEGHKAADFSLTPGSGRMDLLEDSVEALVALGYRKQNAKTAVEKALQQIGEKPISVEDLIRASLKVV